MDMYLCDLKHFVVAYCDLLCVVVLCSVLWWFVVYFVVFCSVLWWFVVCFVWVCGVLWWFVVFCGGL